MSLPSATATYGKALETTFLSSKRKYYLLYLYDVFTFFSTVVEGLQQVAGILSVLAGSIVSLKLPKCETFGTTVTNLGHLVKSGKL